VLRYTITSFEVRLEPNQLSWCTSCAETLPFFDDRSEFNFQRSDNEKSFASTIKIRNIEYMLHKNREYIKPKARREMKLSRYAF